MSAIGDKAWQALMDELQADAARQSAEIAKSAKLFLKIPKSTPPGHRWVQPVEYMAPEREFPEPRIARGDA